MPKFVPFASNYINRSNSLGFQWEFYCFRCGNGYMSTFQPLSNVAAEAGGVVARRGAAHIPIFGGLIGEMASDAMSDKAKDAALDNAIREVYPLFAQCPRCGRWRCRAHCWNADAGLCIDCAPYAAANPSAARPMIPAPVAAPMASAAPIQPYAPSQPYGVATGMPAAPQSYAPQAAPPAPGYGYPAPYSTPYMPGMAPQPSYPAYPPQPMAQPHTSGKAIAAFVLSLVSLIIPFGPIISLLLGYSALGDIKRSYGSLSGSGLALAAVIISWVVLAFQLLETALFIFNLIMLSNAPH